MVTPGRPSTRERLLDATVSLMRTKGPAASGTHEILTLADAPRGSLYFHFPDGKDQLVLEALERAAAGTRRAIAEAFADEGGDPAAQVRSLFAAIAEELDRDDYGPGCAVGATTLETAAVSPEFRTAVAAAFAGWTADLAGHLIRGGTEPELAERLAEHVVAAMEGATMLARARRDTAPLLSAGDLLAATLHVTAGDTAGRAPRHR